MGVKFLSEEWADAVSEAINGHEGFSSSIANTDLSLQFVVTDAPEGDDIKYYLTAEGGEATFELGERDDVDVTVTNDYSTAASIFKGELNTQAAFMTGKLKVAGNLAKLMMNQGVISQWGNAVEGMEVDY